MASALGFHARVARLADTTQCEYEPLFTFGGWARKGPTCRAVKVVAGVALGVGCTLLAVPLFRRAPYRLGVNFKDAEIIEKFHFKSFPTDCPKLMEYDGCLREAWACEESDGTREWDCCCRNDIWKTPTGGDAPASDKQKSGGGTKVFRLLKTVDVCLGGPESPGMPFRLAVCGQKSTRFLLPKAGVGPLQFAASHPGKCVGVSRSNLSDLELAPCSPTSTEQIFQLSTGKQMFELADGDGGMLQWYLGKGQCLACEGGGTQVGCRIVLADCGTWPPKPSQHFVMESMPDITSVGKSSTGPSLFCCSLMMPWSYEVGLLKAQLKRGVGIFACNEWAVYSNESITLWDKPFGKAIFSDLMQGPLHAPVGGESHTVLNTPVFRRFWKQVGLDPKVWRNDWIVKVDPDCVFFPDRLKGMLLNWRPGGTVKWAAWLNNCQLGLHGPLEVFNKQALGTYTNEMGACNRVAAKHRQEDVYMEHCFEKIGVGRIDAYNLLLESEWACNERPSSSERMPPCYAPQVSFHPFKSVKSYFFCHERAAKMRWSGGLNISSHAPDATNHHHA